MICNNKHCWRCQRIHNKDAMMAKKGFYPRDMGDLGRVYMKLSIDKDSKIEVSGTDGSSLKKKDMKHRLKLLYLWLKWVFIDKR